MMDAKGVRNNSIPVVVNKHNNAIVASCWFIVYYGMDCLTCDNTMLKISNKVSKFYSITFSIKFFSIRELVEISLYGWNLKNSCL